MTCPHWSCWPCDRQAPGAHRPVHRTVAATRGRGRPSRRRCGCPPAGGAVGGADQAGRGAGIGAGRSRMGVRCDRLHPPDGRGAARQGQDPSVPPKARKNPTEREGARSAHRRDGVAMARFLHWLDEEAGGGSLDEIAAVTALERFRRDTGVLKDVSFDTASPAPASTPPSRITGCRRPRTARSRTAEVFLDSGAQYGTARRT